MSQFYTGPPAGPYLTGMLARQATTGPNGFALQNATPVILTWNVPNDGQLHRFIVASSLIVSVAETGGQVNVHFTTPDGTVTVFDISNGGGGTGFDYSAGRYLVIVKPGTTVTISQDTALTLGAAILWAEIWGS